MKRSTLISAAWLLDQIAGDPEWFPHPVRAFGLAIEHGETALRRPKQSRAVELLSGAALTLGIVTAAYYGTAEILRQLRRRSEPLATFLETLLGWTCLAARNLEQEATVVSGALASGNILLARQRLARIVGRDTDHLDACEISRAVIETVAESASDGIVAPLFYMTLGGVPLAMAYKAVNTLDSMIGHRDSRYFYFGKAAARLDDAANYLPARFTALAIVAASQLSGEADPMTAWTTWRRDGAKHKSLNAGQPESAMAGALQVRLGGLNTYAGEATPAQIIGEGFPRPTYEKARQAIRIVSIATLLGAGAGILLAVFGGRGRIR